MGKTFKDDHGKNDGGRGQATRLAQTLEQHLAQVEHGMHYRAGMHDPAAWPIPETSRAILAEGIRVFIGDERR